MFRKMENQLRLNLDFTSKVKIDSNNRWVKLSNIIPWQSIEERYAKNFKKLKVQGQKG